MPLKPYMFKKDPLEFGWSTCGVLNIEPQNKIPWVHFFLKLSWQAQLEKSMNKKLDLHIDRLTS